MYWALPTCWALDRALYISQLVLHVLLPPQALAGEPRVSEARVWFRKVLAISIWPVGRGVRLELGGWTPALLQVLSMAEASVLGVNKALSVSAVCFGLWEAGMASP